MLRSHQDHGWGHYLEVLVFVFWLASATSYRVVSRCFNIPRSTVHEMVHRVTKKLLKLNNLVIHFPSHADLENVIACCTILHNICVSNGDIMEPAEEVFRPDDNADQPHLHQDQQRGEQIRSIWQRLSLLRMVWWQLLRLSHCSSRGMSPPDGGNKGRRLDRWPPPKCLIHEGVPLHDPAVASPDSVPWPVGGCLSSLK
ncbi:hypothetical protein AAFF_G00004420 [Aldrovandia affinis]|uniref:Nuclease HARBI1 n=1 Tax=Aldrovandia affinis TaxID=143900 RepID=A0AAD7TDU8_9TELE|nr:hypothetical protein AAFF_G00004420 [Aldrovandia affinis]